MSHTHVIYKRTPNRQLAFPVRRTANCTFGSTAWGWIPSNLVRRWEAVEATVGDRLFLFMDDEQYPLEIKVLVVLGQSLYVIRRSSGCNARDIFCDKWSASVVDRLSAATAPHIWPSRADPVPAAAMSHYKCRLQGRLQPNGSNHNQWRDKRPTVPDIWRGRQICDSWHGTAGDHVTVRDKCRSCQCETFDIEEWQGLIASIFCFAGSYFALADLTVLYFA